MRGYGRSTIHSAHGDYALEHGVHDMLDLLVHLGRDHSIWGSGQAASVPCDAGVISEQDLSIYVAAFARTGLFGPELLVHE